MTVTPTQVRAETNASEASLPDAKIQTAIDVALKLVTKHVGTAEVPPDVIDRATLLVTVEQINQDKAPNGVLNQVFDVGVGDDTSTPVRIGRDPMKPAYPVLAPWVNGRFFCA